MSNYLRAGRFQLDLSETKIMGVLNCTPDSFSDGGHFVTPQAALERAAKMIDEGVDIIDVGAESTRPGSKAVSIEEELARLLPVVEVLVRDGRVPISIDTKKTAVMRAVLELGVDMINDVHGFEDDGALATAAASNCALCIMHMRGMPENMQTNTQYSDVVGEVERYLEERIISAEKAGVAQNRIIVDPGFGFGKNPSQNMMLIKQIASFVPALPKLIGVSRKSTIGYYLGDAPVEQRLHGSVTLAALGAWLGAAVVRVHDVKETGDALKMVKALKNSK
ncbi:dihydropteroate synthase [Cardiobacteriaceae bacterium TAE3-ERU3]|nr:dihydropteroate synthase [Cardiobacteriaceae bacterium TAE3-ERU3]